MAPYEAFFKGKRVTLLGLGLLGRSVGDAEFIARLGAPVTVTDLKTHEELAESVTRLEGLGVTFHLGGHDLADFTDTDMVIKSAGVRLDSKEVAAARAAGVPVYMSTALAAKFASEMGVKIIGVTGTRGKSTVAHMIHHALVASGQRSHLGGNIRGISTLAMLPSMHEGDALVLELDSWQLQGFGDLKLSPHIAVFTNLKIDHQNYYSDMDSYFGDKVNIFRFQKESDTLIVGQAVESMWIRNARPPVAPKIPGTYHGALRVLGEHNKENAALAAEALRAIGLSQKAIENGLASFDAVEGRLQFVAEREGVKIFNDNNATTPDATMAAVAALSQEYAGRIVLIMGGADKKIDATSLISALDERRLVVQVVLLPGTGTEKIKPLFHGAYEAQGINDAVNTAFAFAKEHGGVILFSPGFASFGMFKNEYDRNDQFLKMVNAL